MSEDEAFRAAIQAEPFDDLRRLVYADWLDEHDRPADAEYLRLGEAHRLAERFQSELLGGQSYLYGSHVTPPFPGNISIEVG